MLNIAYEIENIQGEFRMINPDEIEIDEATYQRGKTALVNRIVAEGWNWPKGGAITVAERPDESKWVMDGGNRLRGAKQLAIPEIACMVFQSTGPEQEAGTFSELNTDRMRLSGHSLQRGLVVAGSPEAIFANNLVMQAAEYQIKCARVETLLRNLARKEHGRERLRAIWPIIVRIYTGLKVEGPVINGLYWIEEHADGCSLSDPHWRDHAIRIGVNELAYAAKQGAILKASAPGWGMGIFGRLNQGRRKRFKIKEEA